MTGRMKNEQITLKDGVRVEGETLKEILTDHPEIESVILFWAWESDYYTSYAGIFAGYVTEKAIDEEYSLNTDREGALEFSDNYSCWDGHPLYIFNGKVLYGYNLEADMQRSWNDGYDHTSGLGNEIDPDQIIFLEIDVDYEKGIRYILAPGEYQ